MTNGRFEAEDRHLRTLFGVGAVGDLSDGQLLERFATLGGDPAELAFAALVERHGAMVLRVARSVHRDEHGAHDAFQATFLLLARKARSLWVRDSLGPWLHAVACRVAAHQRSSEIRRRRHERESAGPESDRPRNQEADDLGRAIHEEIDRLPEHYRSAVVLCHLENLTQHEAARRLGWPVGTLQSRLARGRAKLRENLRRRGLAPTLRVLPPVAAPDALVAATARAASTIQLGGPVAGVIAPSVLAMINATSKGMLMTKLKFGSTILLILGGLLATSMTPGNGRFAVVPGQEAQASAKLDRPPAEPGPPLNRLKPAIEEAKAESIPKRQPEPETSIPEPARLPSLLVFHAVWSDPCLTLRPELDKLDQKGYVVRRVDIDAEPDEVKRHAVKEIPTLIVYSQASGRELARTSGTQPASKIAEFYNRAVSGTLAPDAAPARSDEPAMAPEPPRPWETVVRIKVHFSDKDRGFGSGTIIQSTESDALILTAAHFLARTNPSNPEKTYPSLGVASDLITVDLFDGKLAGLSRAKVRCVRSGLPARLIGYNPVQDLALIQVEKTNGYLPVSPLAPARWKPLNLMGMYSVGCSNGDDATPWTTTIQQPNVPLKSNGGSMVAIRCEHAPRPGRSGGGLFTMDGYLAGVCLFADPESNSGLYANPETIRAFLYNQGQRMVLKENHLLQEIPADPAAPNISTAPDTPKPSDDALLEPAAPHAVSDQERRLANVERKLDRIIEALKIDSLKDAKGGPGQSPTTQPMTRPR